MFFTLFSKATFFISYFVIVQNSYIFIYLFLIVQSGYIFIYLFLIVQSGYNDQICYECDDAGTEHVLINGITCEDCIDHCKMCEAVNGVVQCAENMCDDQ